MQDDEVSCFNPPTFVALLRTCGQLKDVSKGIALHVKISKLGLPEQNSIVGNAALDFYIKCGLFFTALKVFEKFNVRDVVSWTTLIAGYADRGLGHDVVKCLEKMKVEGVLPNVVTLVCGLKGCANVRSLHKGQEIHTQLEIRSKMLEENRFIGSTLVDMYFKCGVHEKARRLFDMHPNQDVIAWNTLITRYCEYGLNEESCMCFKQMQLEGIAPNSVTFISILKACSNMGACALGEGNAICADIERLGLSEESVSVCNALIHMYVKFGLPALAQEIFRKRDVRDVITWNTVITGYSEYGHGKEAFECLNQMQTNGFLPDVITFISLLRVCATMNDIEKGKQMHCEIEKRGLLTKSVIIGNALVDAYASCGYLTMAEHIFNCISIPDTYTWNALMTGYSKYGDDSNVMKCLENMQLQGVPLDAVTFICTLKACSNACLIGKCQETHLKIEQLELLEGQPDLGNALMDMYVNSGMVAKAQEMFDSLPIRSIVSWTSLITGYMNHGLGEEVIKCFELMQFDGISPDAMAFGIGLKACGRMTAINKGEELHIEIEKRGLLESDLVCGRALVDMYVKCCCMEKAQQIFFTLSVQDVVIWTTLMTGYLQLGDSTAVFCIYKRMLEEGIEPDNAVISVVLGTCRKMGFVNKTEMFLEQMSKDYGIVPTEGYFLCMIDLFSLVGQLDKALELIKKFPKHLTPSVWNDVLCACRYCGNSIIGKYAFQHALQSV